MDLIAWREDFSIGLDEVDHEHRELIAMINRLHAEIARSRRTSSRSVSKPVTTISRPTPTR